ncbi:MAG TPA: tRNA-guanine transglycosylase DpdA [Longimicrobiaceae bacterium]
MKYFFPDSHDSVDPSFNFEAETRAEFRIRQRDDLYAHEIFQEPPFDGVLVSKAIVDGSGSAPGKYSLAQRHRLFRLGIRDFLRLDEKPEGRRLETMGDCGAFSYVREEYPPFSVEEVIQFYSVCGFDYGMSVDHAILHYFPDADQFSLVGELSDREQAIAECQNRQEITLDLANNFWKAHQSQKCDFTPVGVAQGWSPASYAKAVERLQEIGYTMIALGGMVPLKTRDILDCLERISPVRRPETRLHLLGVTRCDHVEDFQRFGVASFDSTMPLMQAFKDGKDNYHTLRRPYMAVRVPQVQGNPKLQRQIGAGQINQAYARRLEQACLQALREYDREATSVESVLDAVLEYERLHDGKTERSVAYRQVLEDRPWEDCPCEVCTEIGINVIIFRGAERNRRRGFHNLTVLYDRLHQNLSLEARVRDLVTR